MNEGEGKIVNDMIQTTKQGKIVGNCSWINTGPCGGGIQFKSSSYIDTEWKMEDVGPVYCISLWACPDSLEGSMLGNHDHNCKNGIAIQYSAGWHFHYGTGRSWPGWDFPHPYHSDANVGFEMKPGQWSHMFIQCDASKIIGYQNGELKFVNHTNNAALVKNSFGMLIGQSLPVEKDHPNNHQFLGSIEDVRIYNGALSQHEIMQIYKHQEVQTVESQFSKLIEKNQCLIQCIAAKDTEILQLQNQLQNVRQQQLTKLEELKIERQQNDAEKITLANTLQQKDVESAKLLDEIQNLKESNKINVTKIIGLEQQISKLEQEKDPFISQQHTLIEQQLTPNQFITSNNNMYFLVMQGDGNLVLYKKHHAIWSSNTCGTNAIKAIMQGDGNFVLYTAENRPLWDSKSHNHAGAQLVLQDDGNLVIYQGTKAIWASNTVGK